VNDRLVDNARQIAALAWPVLIGQIAVLAFGTIDTVLAARYASLDLAALAVGGAVYITVFVGFMGAILAISPIVGQFFGARRLEEAGEQLHQSAWLAAMISVPGCALLLFPEPFLALSHATPEIALKVRAYLDALAFALPASLLFTAFRGFNTAVSRPKAVMAIQLGGLALKVPLSALFVFGSTIPAPASLGGPWQVPDMGAPGCGIATAIVMWIQLALAWTLIKRDRFYLPFKIAGRPLSRPSWVSLKALLKLGVPMGLSILVEVTGFTFMAFFIARIGLTAVAGHQIAANLVALLYMMPLALANAGSTLVAQRVGAGDVAAARRMGWHTLFIGICIAAVLGTTVLMSRHWLVRIYTQDPAVIAAALPLIAWCAVFHLADATQVITSFVLRAWRVATVPLLIYCFAIWGIGLGGGFAVAFDIGGLTPAKLRGASGFWFASTAGLWVAAILLCSYLAWTMTRQAPVVARSRQAAVTA
jgi:MATE family multidrug resistance protein